MNETIRPDWLDPELGSRLTALRFKAAAVAQNAGGGGGDPPSHGEAHCKAIENALHMLLPDPDAGPGKGLTQLERFLLLASPWCLYTGAGREAAASNPVVPFRQILDNTLRFLQSAQAPALLGLSEDELKPMISICEHQDTALDLEDMQDRALVDSRNEVRTPLLAAYLRLGDAVHVDVPDALQEALKAVALLEATDWRVRFHWLESVLAPEIVAQPERQTLSAHFHAPSGFEEGTKPLAREVVDGIERVLATVKNTLVKAGPYCYLRCEHRVKPRAGFPADKARFVEEMIRLRSLLESPNASTLLDVAIDTLRSTADWAKRGPQRGGDLLPHVTEILRLAQHVSGQRPCHVALRAVVERTEELVRDHGSVPEVLVRELQQYATARADQRRGALAKMAAHAARCIESKAYGAIVVYGFSRSVLRALEQLGPVPKQTLRIHVCEGRPKTRYVAGNRLAYCDGVEYALAVRSLGFRQVHLVPDLAVASLMERGVIGAVLFGANGVAPDGRVGHSGGHLGVAMWASSNKVDVFVLAEKAKTGPFEENRSLRRGGWWLTGDETILAQLERETIELHNPREDIVPASMITGRIDEDGVHPAQPEVGGPPRSSCT